MNIEDKWQVENECQMLPSFVYVYSHLLFLMQEHAVCDKTFSRSEKLSPEILPSGEFCSRRLGCCLWCEGWKISTNPSVGITSAAQLQNRQNCQWRWFCGDCSTKLILQGKEAKGTKAQERLHQLDEKLWNAVAIGQPKPSIKRFHHARQDSQKELDRFWRQQWARRKFKLKLKLTHPTLVLLC